MVAYVSTLAMATNSEGKSILYAGGWFDTAGSLNDLNSIAGCDPEGKWIEIVNEDVGQR